MRVGEVGVRRQTGVLGHEPWGASGVRSHWEQTLEQKCEGCDWPYAWFTLSSVHDVKGLNFSRRGVT